MNSSARDAYLENQILSAAPQQLRLMLIDGAIRFAPMLSRARGIVGELMSSITPDGSELTRRVAGIYLFLFQTLAQAGVERDSRRVREAIEVLAYDRETWRRVCNQSMSPAAPSPGFESGHRPLTGVACDTPLAGGLTLEA